MNFNNQLLFVKILPLKYLLRYLLIAMFSIFKHVKEITVMPFYQAQANLWLQHHRH